jgi:DHA2 family methylenomycin A resistance protein-like MFS transporter
VTAVGRTEGDRSALALAASSLAFALVLLDTSLVNVALPAIRNDFAAGMDALQWVVNAYTLVFASLLMTAGVFVDRLSASRMLWLGSAIFAAGSLGASAAPGVWALVAVQAGLGAGASLLVPASLSLLTRTFPESSSRARALGIWASVAAVAFAASPVIGGVIIDLVGWRGVFAVNLPLIFGVMILLRWAAAPAPTGPRREIDLPGQVAATVALAALTFGLIESGTLGWAGPAVIAAFVVALAAALAFVMIQSRTSAPILPLELFSRPGFSASVIAGVLMNFALYGQLFLISLYLQEQRGLSATDTGLMFLSQPAVVALTGVPAGCVIGRIGYRLPLAVGGAAGALGALLLTGIDASTSYATLIAALVCFGVAGGTIVPAITSAVVASVPAAMVGVASSALNAARQTGAVLGIAVLGGMVSQTDFVSGLPQAMGLCGAALLGVCAMAAKMPTASRQRMVLDAVPSQTTGSKTTLEVT